jgi:hypothetical protein
MSPSLTRALHLTPYTPYSLCSFLPPPTRHTHTNLARNHTRPPTHPCYLHHRGAATAAQMAASFATKATKMTTANTKNRTGGEGSRGSNSGSGVGSRISSGGSSGSGNGVSSGSGVSSGNSRGGSSSLAVAASLVGIIGYLIGTPLGLMVARTLDRR